MITTPASHPENAEMWMPDFYRNMGFYHAAPGCHVEGLEPPSSTFPQIPRPILDEIAGRVRVIRQDADGLVEVPPTDPVKETFYFTESIGDFDVSELELCKKSVFQTIHTNSWFFKPSIEEIALQIPPEMWGVTKFLRCDRAANESGEELSWPPGYLVDPESDKGIYPNRLHLAVTTLYTIPSPVSSETLS